MARSSSPDSPRSPPRPGPFRLAPGTPAAGPTVRVTQTPQAIEIDTGKLQCRIPKQGAAFIETMTIDGRVVARDGRLICTLEDRSTPASSASPSSPAASRRSPWSRRARCARSSRSKASTRTTTREWLPFTVRLYFYAGAEPVRLVHTIVFDGDHEQDFISGLGLVFAVPDARAGTQSPRAILGRRRRPVVRTRAAADRAPPAARRNPLPRSARGQAHRQQGNLQRRRPEAPHRLGSLGRLQARPAHCRRLHHSEAHQPAELLAGRDRRPPRRAAWSSRATSRAASPWA